MKKVSLILLVESYRFRKKYGSVCKIAVRQLLTRQIVNKAADIIYIILLFDFGIYKFSIF